MCYLCYRASTNKTAVIQSASKQSFLMHPFITTFKSFKKIKVNTKHFGGIILERLFKGTLQTVTTIIDILLP